MTDDSDGSGKPVPQPDVKRAAEEGRDRAQVAVAAADDGDVDDAPGRPIASRLVLAAVAVVGLYYGYDFGNRLSGTWLGLVTALSTGVFAVIVTDSLFDLVQRLRSPRRGDDG